MVAVDGVPRPMQTTIQWLDDPSAQTPNKPDTMELAVKVWFTPNTVSDADVERVHLRTLRTL
jgi:hypothetical protein